MKRARGLRAAVVTAFPAPCGAGLIEACLSRYWIVQTGGFSGPLRGRPH